MNVVADPFPLAVLVWTPIVPAIGRSSPFGEAFATFVTEQLPRITGVSMEFELEFRCKCSFAVPTDVGHD
jgi:hypothetical protein